MLNPTETLSQKFVKKGFWLYAFTLLTGPLGYIIKVIISNDLGVDTIGIIYGTISFVALLGAFNDLGCTESLNYFLPKYIIKNEYGKAKYLLKLTLILQVLSSLTIAVLLFFLAPWLATHYFDIDPSQLPILTHVLQISGIYFMGINIFHISTVLFSIAQDTKFQKGADFVKLAMTAIFTIILWITDTGSTEGYMYAWLAGMAFACLFSVYFSYTRYYRIYFSRVSSEADHGERKLFFQYALATLITANIGTLLSQIDMQMIIIILGTTATGYYSNYLSLMGIPFIFISPLFGFLFPVISELHGRSDSHKMGIIHREFSLYFSMIGIWISAFLWQFGETLSVFFFGEVFRQSGTILGYSALFLTFNLLVQINFQFLAGTGKIGDRARILAIILPINIILNYICIKLYGVAGSALAVGLSWIPLWYLSYRATRIHSSGFDWKTFGYNTLIAIISMILCYELISYFHLSDTTRGGAFSILGIAILINLAIFVVGNWRLLSGVWTTIRKNR